MPCLTRITLILLGLAGSLPAATMAERDEHFDLIISLIDREMRLVAVRQLEAFRKAGYNDPNNQWADTLEYHLSNRLKTSAPGTVGEQYQAKSNELYAAYAAKLDSLPARLRRHWDKEPVAIDLINRFKRQVNENDSPIVSKSSEEGAELKSLVRRIIQAVEEALTLQQKKLDEFKPSEEALDKLDAEKDKAKYEEINEKAGTLRMEYVNFLYQAWIALREVVSRPQKWGIEPSFVEETIIPWWKGRLVKDFERFSEWDFQYGETYPLIKSRLVPLFGEALRFKRLNDPTLQSRTLFSGLTMDMVTDLGFKTLTHLDLKQFDARFHRPLRALQFQAWTEWAYWYLLMGQPAPTPEFAKLWVECQEWLRKTSSNPLGDNDPEIQQRVGILYLVAARVLKQAGDNAAGMALLAELIAKKNFFAGNAKNWLIEFQGGGGSGGDSNRSGLAAWTMPPRPQDPAQALTVGQTLLRQADNAVKAETQEQLRIAAAISFRNGLLGLPGPDDPVTVATAPQLYRALATVLNKLGWIYHASAVTQEALQRCRPDLWGAKPSAKNPWFDKNGKITPAGALVRAMASDFSIYASKLMTAVTDSSIESNFSTALKMLEVFDPDTVGSSRKKMMIVILIRQNQYREARKHAEDWYRPKLEEFKKEKSEEKKRPLQAELIDALYYYTLCDYNLWQEALTRNVPAKEIDEIEAELDKKTKALAAISGQALERKDLTPAEKANYLKVKGFTNTVDLGKLFKRERFDELLARRGPATWAELPEQDVAKDDLRQLITAVAKIGQRDFNSIKTAFGNVVKAADQAKALRAVVDAHLPVLLVDWAAITHARRCFGRVLTKYPSLESESLNHRKVLSNLFKLSKDTVGKWSSNQNALAVSGFNKAVRTWLAAAMQTSSNRWCGGAEGKPADLVVGQFPFMSEELAGLASEGRIRNADFSQTKVLIAFVKAMNLMPLVDADQDGELTDAELDQPTMAGRLMDEMERRAKRHYADLYEPLCSAQTSGGLLLDVARSLWEVGEKQRSARIYEMFKESNLVAADLDAFRKDPAGRISALVTAFGKVGYGLLDFWSSDVKKQRGNIYDLLVDGPDLPKQIRDFTRKPADWTEEKCDYSKAYLKIEEFENLVESKKNVLPSYQKIIEALKPFKDMVQSLALEVTVNSSLMEAYREGTQLDKAMQMAKTLFEYDPRNPRYMREVVEATLEAVRKGQAPDRNAIDEARGIAALLRQSLDRAADLEGQRLWWIAYCQYYELSKALGDVKDLGKDLDFRVRMNQTPAEALAIPAPKDFALENCEHNTGVYLRLRKILNTPTAGEPAKPASQATGVKPPAEPARPVPASKTEEETLCVLDRLAVEAVTRFLDLFAMIERKSPLEVSKRVVVDPDDPTKEKTIHVFLPLGRETLPGEARGAAPDKTSTPASVPTPAPAASAVTAPAGQ